MVAVTKKQREYSEKVKLIPEVVKTVAEHDAEIKGMKKKFYGNGEIGWDEQIRNIQKWIELQMEKEQRRAAWWEKFGWLLISSGIVFTLGFISQFVVFWIKIAPTLTP